MIKYEFANTALPATPILLKVVDPIEGDMYTESVRYANFITKIDAISEDVCIITLSDGEVLECFADIQELHYILQGFQPDLLRRN